MRAVSKFQGCIDLKKKFLIIACANLLVWYGCQGKQLASS